jgi:crotonobetainyl-CoA:carnitine CoA-transferase CaiB-like acyl-CoA transferase
VKSGDRSPNAQDAGGAAQPLAGIRVLDLTSVLAGPFATLVLGDLGAEVWKVERADRGDTSRGMPPFFRQDESLYFAAINRNKKSLGLDLRRPEGRDIVRRLLTHADVLIENARPGALERVGLDWATCQRENPRLILVRISGFGQTGPLKDKLAFDIVTQAMSGAMSITGEEGRPPVRLGLPMGDLGGGLFATIGTLAALQRRARTGRGCLVDVSLHDCLVGLLIYMSGLYLNLGEVAGPVGGRHHAVVPYGTYRAKDGYFVLSAYTQEFYGKMCRAIGRPDLTDDPRFTGAQDRVENRRELEAILDDLFLQRTAQEWCDLLDAADVPAAPILDVGQVLEHPQTLARDMVRRVAHPTLGDLRMTGPILKFPEDGPAPLAPPPRLGEHTRQILTGVLGLSSAEVDALARQGVVREAG